MVNISETVYGQDILSTTEPVLVKAGQTAQHGIFSYSNNYNLRQFYRVVNTHYGQAVAAPNRNMKEHLPMRSTCPYAPPYTLGDSVIRYEFHVPEGSPSKVDLDTIKENMVVSFWNPGLTKFAALSGTNGYYDALRFQGRDGSGNPTTTDGRNFAVRHCMHGTASINHLGTVDMKTVEYNAITGVPEKVKESETGANAKAWVIQTKWETPHFNFLDNRPDLDDNGDGVHYPNPNFVTETHSTYVDAGTIDGDYPLSSYEGNGDGGSANRGIWSSYGKPIETILGKPTTYDFDSSLLFGGAIATEEGPRPNYKGLTMQIHDSVQITGTLPALPSEFGSSVGSLAELCGFNTKAQRVGKLRKDKVIKEAVVAIPFTRTADGGFKFYTFPREWVEYSLGNTNAVKNGGAIPEDSIIDMIGKMKDYVIPPQFNFVEYGDISPFAMYIFEFKKKLNKKDIGDIWQNLPPDSLHASKHVQEAEVTVSHSMLAGDFYGIDENHVYNEMKAETEWLVFKIKQKAQYNYYKKTLDGQDDDNFQFNFKAEKGSSASKVSSLPYSYNWPYDYFTMLELIQIEAEATIAPGTPLPAGTFAGTGVDLESEMKDPSSNSNIKHDPNTVQGQTANQGGTNNGFQGSALTQGNIFFDQE